MQLWGNDLAKLPDYELIRRGNALRLAPDEQSRELQIAIDTELEARWQYIKEQSEDYEFIGIDQVINSNRIDVLPDIPCQAL